ncbi:hypothetical protein DICVIV_12408 [Dictyocaulus viviparus]|uniref:Uncharacterized protein n=1 Tax=Dictyocaulus viviparus TaxID=29172 RepID=A0A0D8XD77_DICVI|nr:hypothetical protein DICVIV_12408 [Dictyocaulus viviparus]
MKTAKSIRKVYDTVAIFCSTFCSEYRYRITFSGYKDDVLDKICYESHDIVKTVGDVCQDNHVTIRKGKKI